MTATQVEILTELIVDHPAAGRERIAALFRLKTARMIDRRTVGVHARRIETESTRVYEQVADWPAWTDAVAFDIPWSMDDSIALTPLATVGGAR